MKVLIEMRSTHYNRSGGIENYVYYLIESVKEKDIQIIIDASAISKKQLRRKYKHDQNIKVICDPVTFLANFLVETYPKLYHTIYYLNLIVSRLFKFEFFGRRMKWADKNSEKVDLVYYPFHLDPIQHTKKPIVSTIHAILPNYSQGQLNVIDSHVKISKALITSWNYPYNEFTTIYPMYKYKWKLIPYIAVQNVNKKDQVAPANIKANYFLYVSFFEERKNHINLIIGYSIARKKNPELPNLILVGGGQISYKKSVENKIKELGLEDNIIVYDYLPSNCISYLYYNCDAVISPTLWEAASGTIVEGSYCGKPLLSSNADPLLDFARYFDLFMIFFDPLTPEDISEKILYFLENKHEIIKTSLANEVKIKKYDIKYFGNKIFETFLEVRRSE